MHTADYTSVNAERIAELFPECTTEVMTVDGVIKRSIDFDKLRVLLSPDIVEGQQERYQFTWPDKSKFMRLANTPSSMTLRPCRKESVDFDKTENLYIEGDNLDVLKLLREDYLGKVQMIYIDPPYNTGNDFVYEDDFSITANAYVGDSGQTDLTGNRLVQNVESNGRFHTDWLNMIYPRLRVSRDLLSKDGIIFISIDDNEVENLRKVCDEIFGKSNMIACFSWRTDGNFDNQAKVKICHEYILAYAKNADSFPAPEVVDPSIPHNSKLFRDEIRNTIIKNGPKNPVSSVVIPSGFPCDFQKGVITKESVVWPQYDKDIVVEDGKIVESVSASTGWASKAQLTDFISNGFEPVIDSKGQKTIFVITRTGAIESIKKREKPSHVISVLQGLGGAQKASTDLADLAPYFDYPKPVALIKYLCSMINSTDALFLDFFSGSATTAHSIIKLNSEDGGTRKFILVQLPEQIKDNSDAYKAGFRTICDIGKERIRKAGKKILEDLEKKESESGLFAQNESKPKVDVGFRVLKLDSSNMQDVYYRPEESNETTLFEDNIKPDRTPEDLLFQVMLECNLPLSAKIETKKIAGKDVFSVNNGYLMACFDVDINEDVIKEVAKMKPYYFILRDSSLSSDNVADNFDQIFQAYSKETIRRVL